MTRVKRAGEVFDLSFYPTRAQRSKRIKELGPVNSFRDCEITFCVITLNKTPWLRKSLLSIQKYCPGSYSVKLLSQGKPDSALVRFLRSFGDSVELIVSSVNLGCGGGRRVLSDMVTSPFTMMLDDDMYLTDRSIASALEAFQRDDRLGAVSMPQYDLQGRLVSPGGRNLIIQNGVISRQSVDLNFDADVIGANDLDAGGMLYRTEMNELFSWDANMYDFEDLDKSLQIINTGEWKQAIVPKGRLIHDRSWLGHNPNYERKRLDGLAWRRQYKAFRSKWGMRLDLRTHLLFELVYPTLTLTHSQWLVSTFNRLVQMKAMK